jgi:hypothetical protein
MNFQKLFLGLALLLVGQMQLWAQGGPSGVLIGQDTTRRVITTAVPFSILSPDARSAAMGDVGVALSPDANASFWNPARIAFADKPYAVSLSYTPWLRNLVNDMSISFLSGYYKWDDIQAVDFSMTYFDLGDIQFTDQTGGSLGDFRPREFAFRSHYSRKLTENFSLAVGAFYIHSNLAGNFDFNGLSQSRPGNSFGVDLGAYYTKQDLNIANMPADISFGVSIMNIGSKMSYSDDNRTDFIPTNLRLGGAGTFKLDPYNRITVALDMNKLLVPTPPLLNSQGQIVSGSDPRDLTLLQGMFRSFGDAPNGVREELQEIIGNFGVEYAYANSEGEDLFFVRAGYASEHRQKGDRKFFTVGLGARYQVFGLDVAYLIPTRRTNPLSETLRFTLSLRFGDKKEEAK